ncbi:unnamed protein product [Allacma fusca]|uniref:Phospholipid scramblase n=1 Tax=Allacma fusca TaxID=39272 RepID=A0A8J2PT61_9HEXA|nr:unnamed protein product [Allacma fusca]
MSNPKQTTPVPPRRIVEFTPGGIVSSDSGAAKKPEVSHATPSKNPHEVPIPKIHGKAVAEELLEPQGRSIGVNAKLSIGPDKRTRIDNLGGYHEYKSYPERAKAEDFVFKSLNETTKRKSSTISVDSLPLTSISQPDTEPSNSFLTDIRGFIPDGPTSIAPLVTTTHIFIKDRCCLRSSDKDFPPEILIGGFRTLREVVNDANRRIFFIKQTKGTPWWSIILIIGLIQQKFEFILYDKNGKPTLKVEGRQILFGVYSTANIMYSDGTLIAYIRQSICDGSYKLYDEKDRVVFTLVGPVFACYAPCVFCCCDEEFEILISGSADEVGRIGKYWSKDEFSMNRTCFGVNFPLSMPVRSKAIVLGTAICIRYQYFVKLGNGSVLVPVYLLLFLGVFLYFNCFSLCIGAI